MDKVVLGGIFLGGTIPIQTKTHDFSFFHKDGFDLNFKFIANFGLQKHCCIFRVSNKLIVLGFKIPREHSDNTYKLYKKKNL